MAVSSDSVADGQGLRRELPHWVAASVCQGQYGLPVFAQPVSWRCHSSSSAALLIYRQRGPVAILLACSALLPVWSGMSHWYKSEQRNHWFGYWFGHDMFTPPFTTMARKLSYDNTCARS